MKKTKKKRITIKMVFVSIPLEGRLNPHGGRKIGYPEKTKIVHGEGKPSPLNSATIIVGALVRISMLTLSP